MDAPHKIGTPVKQRVKVISGEVKDVRFLALPEPHFIYLVGDGASERWFESDEIEAVPEAQAPVEGSDA